MNLYLFLYLRFFYSYAFWIPNNSKLIIRPNHALHSVVDMRLRNYSYPIYIGKNLFDIPNICEPTNGKKVLIITNEVVEPLFLSQIVNRYQEKFEVETFILPNGEEYKTIDSVLKIIDFALLFGMDREGTFIALGGGVIGDITGFAASIYMRGITYIQIPTTLMAMVDSSVGGKTGINHPYGKNMIGSFYQPIKVIIDIDFLRTLPFREYISGCSEIIKYGLIHNISFYHWLENNVDQIKSRHDSSLCYMIHQSCSSKAEIVSKDEKELGNRAKLNLGHTFGHAIEKNLGYGTWLHGEAVAVGILMSMRLSFHMNLLDIVWLYRVHNLLTQFELPTSLPNDHQINTNHFINAMMLDKKNKNGTITCILLTEPLGTSRIINNINNDLLIPIIKNEYF